MKDNGWDRQAIEWPTVGIALLAYGGFILTLILGPVIGILPTIVLLTLCIALHSSLQHEILHGHPFRQTWANECLATPALGLFIPYGRFRDTHLAHHCDPSLTDPYDDPESNFADPEVWARLPGWRRRIAMANNTLLGRMLLGPILSLVPFYRADVRSMAQGAWPVTRAYLLHLIGVAGVAALWLALSDHALWLWFGCAYLAMAILKIRTYLEHRAHDLARARTVIIEDRGPLAFLFLNNNLHAVHHSHPRVPWYALWDVYEAQKPAVLARNEGYFYRSYADVFRAFFLTAKDPVPHPLMQGAAPLLNASAASEPMHPLGPLQTNQPAFDTGQHIETQPH